MDFGPSFLDDENPELVQVGLGKERFIGVVERNVVVDKDFFDIAIDSHLDFVNSIWVEFRLIAKDPLNSELFLSHGSNSRLKVTIIQITLNNVSRINTLNKKFRSLDEL